MITNSLVPCNGRFPTLIALITMFFAVSSGIMGTLTSALMLSGAIILTILATLVCSKLLSCTFLRGIPSSFTLEMPPYRTPEFGKVIVRSVFDRTLFVLGRSVLVAAPTGLILWILANVKIGDANLLIQVSELLSPIGELLGMDGAIILAFILALPANEILIPIILMIYTSGGSLLEYSNLTELMAILSQNGWTAVTALCVLIFTLFHWPCSTTLMTIKKESGKLRWAILSAILPTAVGALICLFISFLSKLIF